MRWETGNMGRWNISGYRRFTSTCLEILIKPIELIGNIPAEVQCEYFQNRSL